MSTDGRYFNQAEKQLDSNWELLKQGLQDVPTITEWTVDQVEEGKVVGVDPTVVTAGDARKLAEKIKKKGGEYKAVDQNLVDSVWGDRDRAERFESSLRSMQAKLSRRSLKSCGRSSRNERVPGLLCLC